MANTLKIYCEINPVRGAKVIGREFDRDDVLAPLFEEAGFRPLPQAVLANLEGQGLLVRTETGAFKPVGGVLAVQVSL
ncbi:hypothetical protein A2160_03635 [Candidatus Beckwithbacteria bacterium RBG_13_42_9]|uniref:Uncharacterized protein n=1 Tax=Candidatus Beckwithbacteria bacterium RBG_13_42_9 TaxID=1797457 RepID=A0A1F5E8R0_9BACT|nr:MAG: hypothetical protein A2160_03635 [Candidatus Beckwithbacteria bacterium RBG_13_42_9]